MSEEDRGEQRKFLRKTDLGAVVIDTSPAYCVAIALDGATLMMNPAMLRALGYSADEVIGRDYLTTFVPERDRARLSAVFSRILESEPTVNENWVLAKDGSERLVEWHGALVADNERQKYFLGVGMDITERKRTEEALRRSEQKLALQIQQTPLGVIEWDLNLRIVEWNRGAARIFGYSREEALGMTGGDFLLAEEARQRVQAMWKESIRQEGGRRITNENRTKEGKIIVCDWYNTPLVDVDGRLIGVASLVDDVTDQKRVEAELRATQRAQAEMIEQLSAPILDVWEGVLAMPIIGEVDERRAARMTESLLAAIVRARASATVIDVTGIGKVSAGFTAHLLKMVRAAGLLGCRSLICGISPEVALSTVEIERDLGELSTFGTLRDALGYVLRARAASLGWTTTPRGA